MVWRHASVTLRILNALGESLHPRANEGLTYAIMTC